MSLTDMQIANYSTTEQIYNGNRTIVYRGICSDTGKPVVIKLLKKDYPTFNEIVQFRNQYAITKNLDLAGIVKPLALETYGNGLALIMENDSSISLSAELKTREYKGVALAEFFPIAIQLTGILEGLSQNRIIHKDIKPANILIHPETKQVKLIDFSISSLLPKEQQEIQNPNILEGTLAYISPEQTGRMNRGIDYRSDFYSLGVTFYQLLTGKLPFESDDAMELVHCHLARTALPLGERVKGKGEGKDRNSPSVLSDIVMKLMAKNAEERYQSALGLKYDLEKCWQQWQEKGKVEAFELGERDICDRFLIPEKLYGREKEVQTLLESFHRVAEGHSEMMLVAGFSGIGKTAVVNEVHKPIVKQRGYFIKGKFDQFNRNIPFSAFVQAFRSLMEQLLGESDTALAIWKEKILNAVGESGQVIVEVIPELERIIGRQPAVPELSGTAAQNRFNLLLGKFLRVFATQDHPLVIFLDDLQWADSASLNLLKLLMEESGSGYLLMLGAYRDNEVFPAHPLMLTLNEIGKQSARFNTLTLEPLGQENTTRLVADTLLCSPEIATPLSQLVYKKTQGNPFFATQFLQGLHEDGYIVFELGAGYWQCDLAPVRQLALTDDVVEFMEGRLQKLPDATQEVLKRAACIGNRFDLETLAVVCQGSQDEVAADLWKGLQEGFVIPQSEAYKFFQGEGHEANCVDEVAVGYQFLHDRVQQAAYALIPDAQKHRTHWRIGQLLLQGLSEPEKLERIFDLVNQLNLGKAEISTHEEKQILARLNLQAGQKAKLSAAYKAAQNYCTIGIGLLSKKTWKTDYQLTYSLHRYGSEAAYLSGDFDRAESLYSEAISHARTPLDQAKICRVQMTQYQLQGRNSEAVEIQRQSLQWLGYEMPVEPEQIQASLDREIATVKKRLEQQTVESILELTKMQDANIAEMLRILQILFYSAWLDDRPMLSLLAVAKMTTLSLRHGNSEMSPFGYVGYGMIVNGLLKDYGTAHHFGEMAVQLCEQFNDADVRGMTNFLFAADVQSWSRPIRQADRYYENAYKYGMDAGNWLTVSFMMIQSGSDRLTYGKNLDELYAIAQTHAAFLRHIKSLDNLDGLMAGVIQPIRNLLGLTKTPLTFDDEEFKEAKYLKKHENNAFLLSWLYSVQIRHAYLFENTAAYPDSIEKLSTVEQAVSSHTKLPSSVFYVALMHLALVETIAEDAEVQIHWQALALLEEQLKRWATACPENILHKCLLIQGEKARLNGQKVEAIEFYDRAIAGAKANEYLQEEALGNELAAKFYLEWGKEKIAQTYMLEAYYCYARWGAKAKIDHIEATYPQLLTPILQPRQEETISKHHTLTSPEVSSPSFTSTHTSLSESLDLATVLKASQSLSEEIHLERLLYVLMEVIVTNAGANQGTLLWLKDNNLLVAAHWQENNQCKLPNLPLEQYPYLPLSIINTVKRSQETIIVNQGQLEKRWIGDSYLREHQPQSYLCTPILHQGKLLALLYLENKLTPEAFTERRLEILTMLTSQAAISLENAQLYQQLENYAHTLEERVEKRTMELRAAQKQIISQEKLASLGALTAGVAHELRNPLNFVTNYAEGSVEMGAELIEEFQGQQPPNQEDWEYIQESITDLKENAAAIHKHGQRAESIIYNMMQHSRSEDNARQVTDINKLVDEARQLAYHSKRSRHKSFNITFATEYDESIGELEVFSASLSRAFINLIDNGFYAAWSKFQQQGKPFEPKLSITTKNLEKEIEIRIRDNGVGIPVEVQEKIFEPFFTSKPTGEGTGLGLSLTHEIIVGQHGGTLKVNTEPGSFTEFIIVLPV